MLPLRLELKNFMSYGLNVQPVDFIELSLVVLSGENGVGKSSLLEAITWAVWGKARVASDNDLIRIGQTEMEVVFDFEVDGEKYRIIRKRQRKSRGGATILEFQGLKGDEYISLTEPTIKETQEKIIHTIKLSYETFVNSAFIRQGHADEFTGKKAADRKAILGEILGLYLYDELAQKAKEKVRIFENTNASLALYIEQMEKQLAGKEELVAEIEKRKPELLKAEEDLSQLEKKHAELQAQASLLENLKAQASKVAELLKESAADESALRKKISEQETKLKEAEQVLKDKDILEKAFKELKELEKKLELLREKREKLQSLERERNLKEEEKAKLLHAFEVQQKELESKKDLLRSQIKASEEVSFTIQKVKKSLAELSKAEQEKEQIEKKLELARSKLTKIETELLQLKQEGQDLKKKQDQAAKLKGKCPTCQQVVTKEHLQDVLKDYEKELEKKRTTYANYEQTRKKLEQEVENLLEKLKKLKEQLTKADNLQREEGRLQRELDEVAQKKLALNSIRNELTKLQTRKKNDKDLAEIEDALSRISAAEKLQVYDAKEHTALEAKLKEHSDLHEKRAVIERAASAKELYAQNIAEFKERLAKLIEKIKVSQTEAKELQQKTDELGKFETEFTAHSEELTAAKKNYSQLNAEHTALLEKLKQLTVLFDDLQKKQQEAAGSLKDKALYEELAVAFGKKGVQAMIIESVVPEIELETNEILGRMTDNQMQVKFELQKPKKATEGTIETLEIMVADSVGTRNYELFSGGEAFRINFAIRVALSKLLARRAGARLQLLVIDEGFGSQDQVGRDHLVSAINSIKDDFAKIMVITHIEELKDAFPQRIEVRKGDAGSTLKVA